MLKSFGVFLRKFGYFRENLRKSGNSVTAKGRHSWPCCNGLIVREMQKKKKKTILLESYRHLLFGKLKMYTY